MQLNHDDIREFKEIYRQEFGEELSDVDAERRARQVMTFYETILRIFVNRYPSEIPAGEPPVLDPFQPISKVENESGDVSPLP